MNAVQTLGRPDGLSAEEMYERVLANDASCDGRFFFGVMTTGVYCLPSCPARRPLLRNVRFFDTTDEARAAGLRPCRRCHPDDFVTGSDPVQEELQVLAEEVRSDPARYSDVGSLVQRSGYGMTHVFEMFQRNLGVTPAAFLLQSRIEAAKRLLRETDEPVLNVALAAGFRSLSVFHQRFKQATGMTPASFRTAQSEER